MPDPVGVVLLARLARERTEQRKALGGYLLVTRWGAVCVGGGSSARERWSLTRSMTRRFESWITHSQKPCY
jgi:hypothetical protein